MKYLDLVFDEPERDLACDEALLELVETEHLKDEILRIWEPARHFVVLGHGNSRCAEANVSQCLQDGVAIVRRMSGGGAVLQGPGCLNYSLVLSNVAGRFRNVSDGFRFVLERHRTMIGALTGKEVCLEGVSDLAIAGRKFSGNAQYRKSRAILVHGTFLLDFDVSLMDLYLRLPARQPAYRQNRSHMEFVTRLSLRPEKLREDLKEIWKARVILDQLPLKRIDMLVNERYGRKKWSEKF